MRPKIFGAAIFAICFILLCSVAPVHAYYTNMSAVVAIGQPDLTSNGVNQGGSAGANTLRSPRFVSFDPASGKLFVADLTNQRVLIYNKIPTSNNVSADVVIGQPNFTSVAANQGGSVGPNTVSNPEGVFFDSRSGKLFIADTSNSRILIYNQAPTTNNASADVVVGQADFTHNSSNQGIGFAANTLNNPRGVYVDPNSGKLIISDQTNHRVLIYNQIPTTNNASADVVIGQPNFTSGTINQTGFANVAANTLAFPQQVAVESGSGKLVISDASNQRILVYNSVPTTNNASADVVIGQVDFTHQTGNQGGSAGPNTINNPRAIFIDPQTGKLFIMEQTSTRVLIYNKIPTSNNASADIAIGQPDFTSTGFNQGGAVAANTLFVPVGAVTDPEHHRLIVSDAGNNRLLVYNDDTTLPGLSLSNSPQGIENGLIKLTGNASTNVPNYTIKTVQYMINGGGFNGANPTDGSFDSANENFFFTFDPKSNNNTNDGYFVQVQSRNSNYDLADHLVYFQPFVLNTPADRSFVSKALPTFSFSVVKQQTQLKENLSAYKVMVKKSGGDWITYIDSIPVDYASVQGIDQNLQKSSLATNGNGNYEDKKILVTYSNNNSTISVTPKAVDDQGNSSALSFDQNGKLLSNGGYEWKVQAVDKNGHTQETETRKFVVGSSQFSNGSSWFPLQINSISGLGRVYLSTINPQLIKPKYRIQTSNPVFKGIATANSTIQLDLTNQTCQAKGETGCVQTFTANSNGDSQFSLATSANKLKSGNIYQAQFTVSQGGLFNALPPFQISR